jgi:hypothetical protein
VAPRGEQGRCVAVLDSDSPVKRELPARIRELLERRVDTFEKLELIVALRGVRGCVMTIADLATTLGLDAPDTRRVAAELRSVTLVEVTSRDEVQLLPPTGPDYEAVDELVRLYQEDRLTIAKTLGEISMQRIRTMALKALAEAFVPRKKP